MQIKKFLGSTLKQATTEMKNELGGDAVILGTRVIAGDGMYGRTKMFEITAGIDEELIEHEEKTFNNFETRKENFADELKKLSNKIYVNDKEEKTTNYKYDKKKRADLSKQTVSRNIDNELKEIVDTLFHRDVQKSVVTSIIGQLKKNREFLDISNLDNYILSSISSMIPTYNFEVNKKKGPKKVAIVGPTGVGKSTFIAKLAVISKILHKLDVGLISIDTYRLGALDQLRIFSEVSNIEMLVAYEPSDMPGLINTFRNKDVVFIDTAGRSQKNIEHLIANKKFLDSCQIDETYLALSTTSTTKNLFDVAEKFKLFNYNSFIFTKIDEAVTYGNILNIVSNFDIPISFLTNGQVIPDDIISADPDFISKMIYTGKIN